MRGLNHTLAVVSLCLLSAAAQAIPLHDLIDGGLSLQSLDGTLTFDDFGFAGDGGCIFDPVGDVTALDDGLRYDGNVFCGGGGGELDLTFQVAAIRPLEAVEVTLDGFRVGSIEPSGHRFESDVVALMVDSGGASVLLSLPDPIPPGFACTDPGELGACTFSQRNTVSGSDHYENAPNTVSVATRVELDASADILADPTFNSLEYRYQVAVPEPAAAAAFALGLVLIAHRLRRR